MKRAAVYNRIVRRLPVRTNEIRTCCWYTMVMRIKIKLFASLRQFGPDEQMVELPEHATIAEVIDSLQLPKFPLLRIVNGEHRPPEYVLKDGDELAIFPPIAGGEQENDLLPYSAETKSMTSGPASTFGSGSTS